MSVCVRTHTRALLQTHTQAQMIPPSQHFWSYSARKLHIICVVEWMEPSCQQTLTEWRKMSSMITLYVIVCICKHVLVCGLEKLAHCVPFHLCHSSCTGGYPVDRSNGFTRFHCITSGGEKTPKEKGEMKCRVGIRFNLAPPSWF